jgi:hypothetical protein
MKMQSKTKVAVLGLLAIILSAWRAHATDAHLVAVNIDTVAKIGVQLSAHSAGNLEVKLTTGFDPQQLGLNCYDPYYLTTLRSSDSDNGMFELLIAARRGGGPVTFWITDDPAYTAYPGRCSIKVVEY